MVGKLVLVLLVSVEISASSSEHQDDGSSAALNPTRTTRPAPTTRNLASRVMFNVYVMLLLVVAAIGILIGL